MDKVLKGTMLRYMTKGRKRQGAANRPAAPSTMKTNKRKSPLGRERILSPGSIKGGRLYSRALTSSLKWRPLASKLGYWSKLALAGEREMISPGPAAT